MDCTYIRSQLTRYVDNDLGARVRAKIDEHLDHCYLCQEELNEIVALLDACYDALRHPDPRNRFDQLRPKIGGRYPIFDAPSNQRGMFENRVASPYFRRPGNYLKKITSGIAVAAGFIMLVSVAEPVVYAACQFVRASEDTSLDNPALDNTQDVPFREFFAWREKIRENEHISETGHEPAIKGHGNEKEENKAPSATEGPVTRREKPEQRLLTAGRSGDAVARDASRSQS